MSMKKTISVLLCVALLGQLASCTVVQNKTTKNITAMNTVMQITVFGTSSGTCESVAREMVDRIEEIEELFDPESDGSDVNRINSSNGAVSVSDETARLVSISKAAFETTDGAFDITVMPVLKLWGFDNGNYGVAKSEDINSVLPLVGSDKISVDENTVTKDKDTQISFGGIAKGFLGDELMKIAEKYGAEALLSLGGNIVLCGNKNGSEKWSVGVQDPTDTQTTACSFKCDGEKSVVTSGAYERYFEYDGKKYHHIIDPATGYPAQSDLLSVTVIGENGALCDAYSTALFVKGKEKSVEFAKEHDGFDFIFICADNEIITVAAGITEIESENYSIKSIPR